ncbi:MAG: SH3 domain-containing protein [Polyangia bacterium]
MSRSLLRSAALLFLSAAAPVGLLSGCSAELGVDEAAPGGGDAPGGVPFAAASAVVGEQATVTAASSLNLRSGPSTTSSILASMPGGSTVDVLEQSGTWYKVRFNTTVGWCSGDYLAPLASGGTGVEDAIARAKSGVGFSYWWGGGCWSPGSTEKGSCTGSCPGCTHSGRFGADCSGYVAKVWQVPGASAVSACGHPYSTVNFDNEEREWVTVPRAAARRGDAFVYNKDGKGHIFLFEGGDPWGAIRAYEAKGCSYGIVYGTRTASSDYKVIRRRGF